MAIIQGDPSLQQEHCLRNLTDLEPTGSTTALARCSAFILERAMQAVAALDATGEPDPAQRILLPVNLAVRGDTAANLPVFWVRIGQAMHALEDAFAHTYRTTDGTKVTVVLNWVDLVDKQLDAAVNGPPHKIDLDHCNAGDEIRNRNTAQAIEASTALLRAVLDPSLTPAEKSTEVQAVVAQYLAYSPGCTDANAWCNAPENAYTQLNACGCDVVGSQGGSMAALSLVGLALLALRRRRRLAAALVVPAALLVPTAARAEDQPHFAVAANVAGSFIDPAVAGSLGVRIAFGQHFLLGVDGELNGWYGVNGSRLDLGSANVYASAIVRYPIVDRFALRTTFNLGVAIETSGFSTACPLEAWASSPGSRRSVSNGRPPSTCVPRGSTRWVTPSPSLTSRVPRLAIRSSGRSSGSSSRSDLRVVASRA